MRSFYFDWTCVIDRKDALAQDTKFALNQVNILFLVSVKVYSNRKQLDWLLVS